MKNPKISAKKASKWDSFVKTATFSAFLHISSNLKAIVDLLIEKGFFSFAENLVERQVERSPSFLSVSAAALEKLS